MKKEIRFQWDLSNKLIFTTEPFKIVCRVNEANDNVDEIGQHITKLLNANPIELKR